MGMQAVLNIPRLVGLPALRKPGAANRHRRPGLMAALISLAIIGR